MGGKQRVLDRAELDDHDGIVAAILDLDAQRIAASG